jgi:hypothetical protein
LADLEKMQALHVAKKRATLAPALIEERLPDEESFWRKETRFQLKSIHPLVTCTPKDKRVGKALNLNQAVTSRASGFNLTQK